MSLDEQTITQNRRRFVDDLKTNPYGMNQIFTGALESEDGCCALGMALKTFGISGEYDFDSKSEPYEKIMEYLDLTDSENDRGDDPFTLSFIWTLNDRDFYSFSDIGDVLESVWFSEK